MAAEPAGEVRPGDAAAPKAPRTAVKFAAAVLALALLIGLAFAAEFAFRQLSDFGATPPSDQATEPKNPTLYTAEELRRDLPHFTARQGGECMTVRPGLHWDPRFGFASKTLDKDCARKLFAAHPKSVVLLGGSAMENNQAPNYLTTIDSYAFGGDASFATLNLAESGARHSNMLIRLLHDVIELHPTYVVFLDGFNEFNSVRLGGAPEDDFYWTAGVQDRIQNPSRFFRDKVIEQSRILQLLALKTGFISSARVARDTIDPRGVDAAAAYYVKMRGYTQTICEAYRIKCIFIIQPVALLEAAPSQAAKKAASEHLKSFLADDGVYKNGYAHIFRHAGDKVLDATHLFDGKDEIYIDVVHFNKRGSELIGKFIYAAVKARDDEASAGNR